MVPGPSTVTRGQRRALGVLAAVAFLGLTWIALPVGLGLFLGTLVAFTLEPVYQRLAARWNRPALSALACALGAGLSVAGAIAGLTVALAARGGDAVAATGAAFHRLAVPIEALMRRAHMEPGDLAARARAAATTAIERAATAAATIADLTLHALLTLFFMCLAIYFVLRNWRPLTTRVERMLPLHPRHTRLLFRELRLAGRTIFLGTIVTGVAQGVLAAIGFGLFGVPHAPLLGALTTVASLVPAIGTLLVWVPAAAWLIATGHVAAGIGLVLYSLLAVIVLSDYVIRPRLVGGGERQVPTLITFIALFGGAEVFGVVGLVLGPVLVSVCIAILNTWEQVSADGPARDSAPSLT